MLIPDLILLAVVLVLGAWRLLAPAWHPRRRVAVVAVGVLLAAAHWALYGLTWQLLPAYLLMALSALPPLPTGAVWRRLGRLCLVSVATMAVGAWIVPAVPTVPPPDGPYPVATAIHRWTDTARDEPQTSDPTDRRAVIAQAWYPTTRHADARDVGRRLAYIDGIGRMPTRVSGLPSVILSRYGQVETHAEHGAPLAPSDRPWPVVVFLPGYGAPRAVYTGLITRLASRGFVVVALDHPYESAVTELPDGRVVGTREGRLPGERDRIGHMVRQQDVRIADVRFVIDQLARPDVLTPALRGGSLEGHRVAVVGHSFGGAAASGALLEDDRVVAAVNIDGTPYGSLPDGRLARPFLLVQSDHAETRHGEFFVKGNAKLLANMTAPGYLFEIAHANHYSFTDVPFFFAPPGRWLLAQLMGGGRGADATQQATADLVAAFLSGPLGGIPSDIAAAAARHPGITGGAVTPRPAAVATATRE